MPLHADPTMPPGLEDFPWKCYVHVWDYSSLSHCGPRLVIWYPPASLEGTAQQYVRDAISLHMEVWLWLEARFELAAVPAMTAQGRGFNPEGAQLYDQVQCTGTFELGTRRSPRP